MISTLSRKLQRSSCRATELQNSQAQRLQELHEDQLLLLQYHLKGIHLTHLETCSTPQLIQTSKSELATAAPDKGKKLRICEILYEICEYLVCVKSHVIRWSTSYMYMT